MASTRARKMLHRTPIGDTASTALQVEVLDQRQAALARMKEAGLDAWFGGQVQSRDSLKNFVAAIGTHQDKRSHSFYAFPLTLTRVEIENMFRASWLAKRIVRTPADDMCRTWVDRTWDGWDQPGDTSAKSLKKAEKRFDVRGKVNEAATWGRLYGGAGIVFDIVGQEDWSQPLVMDSIKKGQLRALHVLDRWRMAATGELDYDRRSPNYGKPKYYTISDTGTPQYMVHWTRVVKFQGEPLPWFLWINNAFWSDSVLQHVAEVIRDYDATMAGIASLVYEANVDIITAPGLATALAAGGKAAQDVIDRFALAGTMKSINHMMLLDGGPLGGMKEQAHEQYTQKTTAFSGLKDVAEKFMINVCGAADIPMTRLFGQSPAGLTATGESDTRNYYDRLSSDQEKHLRHAVEKIDEVLFRHTFGFMPEDYELTFKPLWQMTDKERAEIEYLRAQRDQIYLVQGAIPEHVVTGDLLDANTYRSLTQKDVEMVERMAAAARMLPPVGKPGQPSAKPAPVVGAPVDPAAGGAAGGGSPGDRMRAGDAKLDLRVWYKGIPAKVVDIDGLKMLLQTPIRILPCTMEEFVAHARDAIRKDGERFIVLDSKGRRQAGPFKTRAMAEKKFDEE